MSAVLLSKRDSFFTRERASQLLFACCYFVNRHIPLDLGPPALLKPKQLWTGKQIITALLKHVRNLMSMLVSREIVVLLCATILILIRASRSPQTPLEH